MIPLLVTLVAIAVIVPLSIFMFRVSKAAAARRLAEEMARDEKRFGTSDEEQEVS